MEIDLTEIDSCDGKLTLCIEVDDSDDGSAELSVSTINENSVETVVWQGYLSKGYCVVIPFKVNNIGVF